MGVIRKKTVARGAEGGVKYHCDVCSVDITSTVRIRCAHSACNDYDLCVKCFSDAQSSGNHQPATHPYKVIEQNSFPIFDAEWGADEEQLLLEGAETYGLGSWADIADHIGGYRSKEEVRDHYIDVYLNSPAFPLPKRCSPHDNELATEVTREEFQARKKQRIEERREAAKNAPALQPKTKPTASVPSCHEIQGYMPGRLEFETEYANEAEEAVQLMQFDPGDGINPRTGEIEPEMELKLTVMEVYNCRLTQRVERKKVMFEHNLLEYRENNRIEKKRSKEEREILNKAKPFARMMNHDDFEDFSQGLVDELNLRQAIAQLQEWRGLRIGDLRSGEKYEQEKTARIQKAIPLGSMDRERLAANQRNKQPPPPDPPSGAASLIAPELPVRLAVPPPKDGTGNALASEAAALAATGSGSNSASVLPNGTNGSHLANGEALNGGIVVAANGVSTPNGVTVQATGFAVNGNGNREPFVPQPLVGVTPLQFSPDNTPDLQLLSPEEIKLCETLRIQPKPYIMIKEQLLKEALKGNGTLKKKQAREICRLDNQKGGRIFEFFVNSGWVGKA